MRRSLCFTVLAGILIAVLPSMPAAGVEGTCGGDFPARLKCWSGGLSGGTVTVTVDHPLPLGGTPEDRETILRGTVRHQANLEVQVPAGVSTGEGGTVLLVLAGRRLVDPDARIDRLSPKTVKELEGVGACHRDSRDLCDVVGPGRTAQVTGNRLITTEQVTGKYTYVVAPADKGTDYKTWLLIGMSALLALLLAALVYAVRRSRPLAAPGIGSLPVSDEPTTRLRTTSASAYGRRTPVSGNGPARSALVRTDLHPQGYVELDRVLYRAVWAQPGRPAPAPGSRVDVSDPAEPDSDVLYAFPPAAGRHAHAR